MDERGTDARVAMATEERVGVAMTDGALTVLVDLLITSAMRVEGGGVVKDVGHTAETQKNLLLVKSFLIQL